MGAKHTVITMDSETIIDDLTEEKVVDTTDDLNQDKLAKLKSKLAKKQKEPEMSSKIVAKKERSISLGIIGSGQAGSRIAEAFYKLGYDAIAMNTASQDLKFIDIPETNKLLLEWGLGGAAKEMDIGKAAAEAHREAIAQLINSKLSNTQMSILCLSLGGGSGAGSCETLVEILSNIGKPLAVITVLPMDTEDSQTKHNALETLDKLTKLVRAKKINNLVVVDNAKIEAILSNVSQVDFYGVANKTIVEPIDVFNTLSSMPSSVKSLDPAEWGKLFVDSEGLTIYGDMIVDNYQEDTAIAEAVINNLSSNLLAGGFDLKESKYVGVLIVANKDVWAKISNSSVNYALAMVNDVCGAPKGIFKGIYTVDMPENVVKVYSMFSGLSLPSARVEQLKKEAQEHTASVKAKDTQRNLNLTLNTGTESAVSEAQKVKDKIHAKTSAFGKLMTGAIVDKRK